jgi:hypothetical protein
MLFVMFYYCPENDYSLKLALKLQDINLFMILKLTCYY